MSGDIGCPCCGGKEITKNGHFRGKQRYVCKECQKSFSEESRRGFPPTTIPFELIAHILYKRERDIKGNNYRNFPRVVNRLLELTILDKKKVSRSTIYSWIKKYGNSYSDLISDERARDFFFRIIDHERINSQPFKARRLKNRRNKRELKKTRKELRKLPEIYKNIPSNKECLQWFVDTLGVDDARKFVRWMKEEAKRICEEHS